MSERVERLADETDRDASAAILAGAFGIPREEAPGWIDDVGGRDEFRILRRDGRVVAVLLHVPMGQWFGGRSVPMTGIAAVATAPHARASGAARALLHASLREMRGGGVPLSALYPSSLRVYRSAGYEVAGVRVVVTAATRALAIDDRALVMRPFEDADRDAVRALSARVAARQPGHLDRGPYVWRRIERPRGATADGYVVERDGAIVGSVFVVVRERPGSSHYGIAATDACALDGAVARRLLTFFADHRTLGEDVRWGCGPDDLLLAELPERGYEISIPDHWMLRITDPARALAARGYLPGVEGELHLRVVDAVLPENDGAWMLRVAGGRAEVAPGGRGELVLDVRGLAALYSGHAPPWRLAAQGLAHGDEASLRRAALLFAGSPPSMPEMF